MLECRHENVTLAPSDAARSAHYKARTWKTLQAAQGITAPTAKRPDSHLAKYPGPLVLPDDDLYHDPEYDPQTLAEWKELWDDDFAEPERRKLYVVPPPRIGKGVAFMKDWSQIPTSIKPTSKIASPKASDVCGYLRAFYDGLDVELLPASTLTWSLWQPGTQNIALRTSTEAIQIRHRETTDGLTGRQLDLNDILDTAIAILPRDALAIVLLVDHDIYEDVDDDFACGRAFGGSHVCVISGARYHPELDLSQNVDRVHSWPASHCSAFVEQACKAYAPPRAKKAKIVCSTPERASSSPLDAAIQAHIQVKTSTPKELASLWLWRLCRTVSHEVGHCLGIDHCVFYACIMQGTASMAEDVRQPPYMCPIDEAKVRAIITTRGRGDGSRRDESISEFCRSQKTGSAFDVYRYWLQDGFLLSN